MRVVPIQGKRCDNVVYRRRKGGGPQDWDKCFMKKKKTRCKEKGNIIGKGIASEGRKDLPTSPRGRPPAITKKKPGACREVCLVAQSPGEEKEGGKKPILKQCPSNEKGVKTPKHPCQKKKKKKRVLDF